MKKGLIITFTTILAFAACNTTKNIPQGQYLLDKIEIKHDTKNATSDLEDYVRQQPNTSLPLLGKVRLGIYNMAGQDSSWINRTIRNIGQAPVIFSPSLTQQSKNQLVKQLQNQGYLDAVGDTLLTPGKDGKKMKVTYALKGGTPYTMRNYSYQISDTTQARIMKRVPSDTLMTAGDFIEQGMYE